MQKGEKIYDKIHKLNGVVIDVVPQPTDGHHKTFSVVKLTDGREYHLVDG